MVFISFRSSSLVLIRRALEILLVNPWSGDVLWRLWRKLIKRIFLKISVFMMVYIIIITTGNNIMSWYSNKTRPHGFNHVRLSCTQKCRSNQTYNSPCIPELSMAWWVIFYFSRYFLNIFVAIHSWFEQCAIL